MYTKKRRIFFINITDIHVMTLVFNIPSILFLHNTYKINMFKYINCITDLK